MPRERSPNRDKAKEIFLQHEGNITNRQIAEMLGEDEKKVAVWKQRDKWNVVQQSKRKVVQQKAGAPKGNKNSRGHGAPKANKNGLKTGAYESIWYHCLTDEERAIYDSINTDTLAQVEEDLRLITIRERRMMERIKHLMDGLTENEKKILQERLVEKKAVEVYDEKSGQMKTVTVPEAQMITTEIRETHFRVIDDIVRLEEALTKVQEKKTRQLALKHTIESANQSGSGTEAAKTHAQALEEAWKNR
ncbi:MAG: phage terminase small subunit [Sporomusaceae bacterium]|nr:phage terminase small subunit [Sporomusaceae bacterium]